MIAILAGIISLIYSIPVHAAIISKTDHLAANHTTPSLSTSPSNHSDPVSWQTAFWTLVVFALNAMTQNSTIERQFPSNILFPARSSPVVCAADMLEAITLLIKYVMTGLSLPDAAMRITRERAWQDPNTGQPVLNPPYPVAHSIVFILGVLPQTIKLFGMSGIPWTQAWGGIYLSSFLVIAGIGALAQFSNHGNVVNAGGPARGIGEPSRVAIWIQVGVWIWCIYELLHPVWPDVENSPIFILLLLPAWIVVMIGPLVTLVSLVVEIGQHSGFFDSSDEPDCCCGAIVVMVLTLLVLGSSMAWGKFLFSLPNKILVRSVTMVGLLLIILLIITFFIIFIQKVPSRSFLIFFGLTNLLLAVLYYRSLYDPTDTIKPSWAEKLG
jgi:hypothetical protein